MVSKTVSKTHLADRSFPLYGSLNNRRKQINWNWCLQFLIPVRLYPKLQSQPTGLRKIFINYFFFQVDQWDCTKPLSIFDQLASSEERFRMFHCTNKLQSQPTGLCKIFIDYLFFQADQSDCTKSVSIFNWFASSEERWNQNVPCQICRSWVFPLMV